MNQPETIFALSSGAPPAAIAIVRVSGAEAGTAVARLAGALPAPRRATLRAVRDGDGNLLDRALLLWFPGPDSATGEDLAELHLHGGRAVVARVLAALGEAPGCRLAEPGEFTRRAFANGRIDLAQAEALADLLAAETEAQRRHALLGAEGALGREMEGWRVRLVRIAAEIEAELDFADEDDVAVRLRNPRPALADLAGEIAERLASPPAERLRDGIRVVIAGPPNSGKSSLLNALAGRDVAIVSPIPGTTRDRVEVPVLIDRVPLLLTDTAGLHDTNDEIERIGIARAHEAIVAADLLLWLGEPGDAPAAQHRIVIHARDDLPGRDRCPAGADVSISVVRPDGLTALRAALHKNTRALLPREDEIALNARQRQLLRACEDHLRNAAGDGLLECRADDVARAAEILAATRGHSVRPDIIDAIFSQFCLGK